MGKLKVFLKLSWMKLLMFVVMIIPSLLACFIIAKFYFQSIPFLLISTIVLAYVFANILDYFLKTKKAKIIAASILGAISLVGAYIVVKLYTEPMICDPVHISTGCETNCSKIIENVTNRSSQLMDKFHECMNKCYGKY